jgi:uncharacterized protein
VLEIATVHGPARAHLQEASDPVGALVLGHGAGGGVKAPDLQAVTKAALGVHFSVALVEQPYRVAGRRSPAPAHQLDTAWRTVVEHLLDGPFEGLALVSGGRSSGARVACRTAADTGARGVLCLAFPLITPQRSQTSAPKTRQPELDAVTLPVLVVQGDRDPFGLPAPSASRRVVTVRGNHALRSDLDTVGGAAGDWLASILA